MSTQTLPYKPGTSLFTILQDGWSRDFGPSQTVDEATKMGFIIAIDDVMAVWRLMDRDYELAQKEGRA